VFGTLHLHYEKHIPQKFSGYRVVIQYGYSPLRRLRENFEIYNEIVSQASLREGQKLGG
jgi:hypothetical protein